MLLAVCRDDCFCMMNDKTCYYSMIFQSHGFILFMNSLPSLIHISISSSSKLLRLLHCRNSSLLATVLLLLLGTPTPSLVLIPPTPSSTPTCISTLHFRSHCRLTIAIIISSSSLLTTTEFTISSGKLFFQFASG